jgi:mRNA-degrading endonuclease RelE of RelBE toxin-antitoxin system
MSYSVLTIPQFERDVKKLSKKFKSIKKDLSKLIGDLKKQPTQGISLGHGVYKIRLANSSIPTGKSGGFRVITYRQEKPTNIYKIV